MPLLLIQGEEDRVTPAAANAKLLARAVPDATPVMRALSDNLWAETPSGQNYADALDRRQVTPSSLQAAAPPYGRAAPRAPFVRHPREPAAYVARDGTRPGFPSAKRRRRAGPLPVPRNRSHRVRIPDGSGAPSSPAPASPEPHRRRWAPCMTLIGVTTFYAARVRNLPISHRTDRGLRLRRYRPRRARTGAFRIRRAARPD